MPKPFSIEENIRTVLDRGNNATRRPLPVTMIQRYLDAIKEAHTVAGVDPLRTDPPQNMCAGVQDVYQSLLQVRYAKYEVTGYERGLFIARTRTGSFALHGMVEAVNGKFCGSQATAYEGRDTPTPVELTKGPNGSLAPIIDMIAMYAETGEFRAWVPESGATSLHSVRAGSN